MSTSPDPIVRGSRAETATAARFQVDFRHTTEVPIPAELLEKVRASAQAAGYAEGWAQGMREAQAAAASDAAQARAVEEQHVRDRAAALERAVAAVMSAADQLAQKAVPVVADLEDILVRGAVELAEALLGRALAESTEPGLDALRRAIALVPDGGIPTVRLHPADLATLSAPNGEYVIAGRTAELRADPTLSPGDAIAEQGGTTVDARLSAAIDRLKAELAR